MPKLGKYIIEIGIIFIIVGIILIIIEKFGSFKLPGDIIIQRKNFTIYIPIITCLLISLILTIIVNLLFRK
jgi:hypothetical protein